MRLNNADTIAAFLKAENHKHGQLGGKSVPFLACWMFTNVSAVAVMEDAELLREYAVRNSEDAFRELVNRHFNLVYATALRQVGCEHLAEDVCQAVFIALAKKARHFAADVILEGWLFRATRFASANALRNERRYSHKIQEAARMQIRADADSDQNDVWDQVVPILNETISELGTKDRNAVLLRFFQRQSFKQVAQRLGTTEEAAKKRVTRALKTLARLMAQRGVAVPATVLAAAITARGANPAPSGLALSVGSVAVSQGAGASSAALTLTKGILMFMAWSNSKTIVVTAVVLLLLGTGGGLIIKATKQQNAVDAKAQNPSKASDARPGEAFFGGGSRSFEGLKLAGVQHGENRAGKLV
jgi:RNA polymerase sigma factor (sigma-70 family)